MSNAKPHDPKCASPPDLGRRLGEVIEGVEVDLGDILDTASSLEEVAVSLVRSALADEDAASGVEERMATLEEAFNGFEEQAEAKRKLALLILAEGGSSTSKHPA